MAIIEQKEPKEPKKLPETLTAASTPKAVVRAASEDEVNSIPSAGKSAPRATLSLSDWDDFKIQDETEKDKYFVPPHLIPDGFSVEWKRVEILGKPDRRNLVNIERAGWRPAPAAMFRDMLPAGYSGDIVEDGEGMVLYIRPAFITVAAAEREYNTAVKKVKDYEDATMNDLSTVGGKSVPKKVMAFSKTHERGVVKVPD